MYSSNVTPVSSLPQVHNARMPQQHQANDASTLANIFGIIFRGLLFKKTEIKERYVLYVAKIHCQLAGGIGRYIILFVPVHLAIKDEDTIGNLAWVNLQTYEMRDAFRGFALRSQKWDYPRGIPDPVLNILNRDERFSYYLTNNLPYEITMRHNPKKKSIYQYYDKMNLSAALSSFQCGVNFTGQFQTGYSDMEIL